MKKYILSILTLIILFAACKERDIDPIVKLNTPPSLTSPSAGTTFTLDEANAESFLDAFTWTAADFGYQAGITYVLQIDEVGKDFAEAINLGSVNALKIDDLNQGRLNNILLAKGLPFGFENELELRVCASVSDQVDAMCSAGVPIKVNPYQAEVIYPKLTVPGDYQGWDPGNEDFAVYSRKSDEVYTGFIYFDIDPAVYKFAKGLSWDLNWGDIDPADGVLDFAGVGNDIPTTEGIGLYYLTCDLNALTHENMKTDWGVHGDATSSGWTDDVDFTWDEGKGALSVTLDLSAGEIKFRANDSDDLNFGDDFTNGTLEFDGDNIPITDAGNYTIDLYLTVSDYYYELTKN